jgi:hypothetical protein
LSAHLGCELQACPVKEFPYKPSEQQACINREANASHLAIVHFSVAASAMPMLDSLLVLHVKNSKQAYPR